MRGRRFGREVSDVFVKRRENTIRLAGIGLILLGLVAMVRIFIPKVFFWIDRISGPLEVMRGYMADLANGTWPTIRPLRKKDEFKELYDAFRRAVDGMKQQKQADLAAMKSMLEAAQGGTNATDDECRRALEDIAQQVNRMCDDLARTIGQGSNGDAPTRSAAPVRAMMVDD